MSSPEISNMSSPNASVGDPALTIIPRKYFSGGFSATNFAMTVFTTVDHVNPAQLSNKHVLEDLSVNFAMITKDIRPASKERFIERKQLKRLFSQAITALPQGTLLFYQDELSFDRAMLSRDAAKQSTKDDVNNLQTLTRAINRELFNNEGYFVGKTVQDVAETFQTTDEYVRQLFVKFGLSLPERKPYQKPPINGKSLPIQEVLNGNNGNIIKVDAPQQSNPQKESPALNIKPKITAKKEIDRSGNYDPEEVMRLNQWIDDNKPGGAFC